MRWLLGLGAVAAVTSATALADDKRECLANKDHNLRIKGCSAMIQRDSRGSIAYHNRGTAYYLNGDVDRAISDFNRTIELNPNYAPAYNSRGRAYASKGDFTHAVADVTKATELAPAASPSRKDPRKSPARKAKAVAKQPGESPKHNVTAAKQAPPEKAWPDWTRGVFEN